MIRTILVPLGVAGTDAPAFTAALWAARLFGGHIDFLYARVDPSDAASQAAEFLGGAIPSADMIERLSSRVLSHQPSKRLRSPGRGRARQPARSRQTVDKGRIARPSHITAYRFAPPAG
jgi:hypothetical protein